MRPSRSPITVLVASATLSLLAAGCGGGDDSGDAGTTAPQLVPPAKEEVQDLTAPTTGSTPTVKIKTVEEAGDPGSSDGGDVIPEEQPTEEEAPPPPPPDNPKNDTPPPPGSSAERFEQQCSQKPSKCGF